MGHGPVEALRVVFTLDGDDSGSIEMEEVLHLATGMSGPGRGRRARGSRRWTGTATPP